MLLDVANVALVQILALRVGRSLWPDEAARARRLATVAALAYAVYLPAISFSQFATSEIPALLLTLLSLVLVTSPRRSWLAYASAGVVTGLLCLTRPSLLPLLVIVPVVARSGANARDVIVFMTLGSSVVGAHVLRNWMYAGEFTISTNSAYNLYIGNRDMYAEDLNLLSPRATPAQIEFRRQQFSGQLPPFTQSPAESQRLALEWIQGHPGEFARRAVGRFARVFVPRTDVLEMIGGEANARATSPASLALLAATNVQWAVVLFGGIAGIVALRHRAPSWSLLFAATIAGAVLLCLIAISKPRYSFVFDPLLIIGVSALWLDRNRFRLTRTDAVFLAAFFIFLVWGWVAFAIFAISSRAAI